jgi:hypothetical protein
MRDGPSRIEIRDKFHRHPENLGDNRPLDPTQQTMVRMSHPVYLRVTLDPLCRPRLDDRHNYPKARNLSSYIAECKISRWPLEIPNWRIAEP